MSSKFNINMIGNWNKPVSAGQRSLFKSITGFELPPDVVTFGGAHRAYEGAKLHGQKGLPISDLTLEQDAFATMWDNSTRKAVAWNPAANQNYTLVELAMSPRPKTGSGKQAPSGASGGGMTTINVPAHSGVVEPRAPTPAPAPEPAKVVAPKPKAPEKTPSWVQLATTPITGFSANAEIEHLVPGTGPNGLPMVSKREVKVVVRSCDLEYWDALKTYGVAGALGPTGTGKDMSATNFAHMNKLPYWSEAVNGNWAVEGLWGHRDLRASATGATESPYVHSDNYKIVKHGGLLVLNEVNAANPNELLALNQVIEARQLSIRKTNEVVKFHEHAYITFNMNPGYPGTKPMSPAFMGRFPCIVFPAWTKDQLLNMMGPVPEFDRLAALYDTIQKAMADRVNPLRGGTISVRNLLRIQKSLDSEHTLDEALHTSFLNAFKDITHPEYYEAAYALTSKIFGTDVKMHKD